MKTLQQTLTPIVNSHLFINVTTIIIIGYALVLGIKTFDSISTPYEYAFYYLDWGVTLFFLMEVIVKISAQENWKAYFKDPWNVFDFTIVAVSLIPFSEGDYALIARLLRVFRVLRLFTARPGLRKIIDVLFKSIPAIVDVVLLLFIIFYLYAIVGSFIFKELPSGLWENLLISLLTLFRVLTFEDWTDVMYEAMEVFPWAWAYFVSFVILAAFIFFNLFIAVIIGEMQNMNEADMKDEIHEDHEKLDKILHLVEHQQRMIEDLQSEIKKRG
jgi:voltage-gated sodium channel